jgi:hypothetical protein
VAALQKASATLQTLIAWLLAQSSHAGLPGEESSDRTQTFR